MKNIYLFLTVIKLCTGCTKNADNINENNIDSPASTPSIFSAPADDTASVQMPESETKSLQQKIIEDFPLSSLPWARNSYDPRRLACQIEGNFTNSGNREIIGFYEIIYTKDIDTAFCFVFDSNGEKVEKIYHFDYSVYNVPFFEGYDLESASGFTEALGRLIIARDEIGYVGDFNENGKEELFLYKTSGMGSGINIFEFKDEETGFVDFLDIKGASEVVITDIDLGRVHTRKNREKKR